MKFPFNFHSHHLKEVAIIFINLTIEKVPSFRNNIQYPMDIEKEQYPVVVEKSIVENIAYIESLHALT
jgi:hypothetical protein